MMKAASRPLGHDPPMQPGSTNQDLHIKMSKKIAQLTKVIFHLNTRNEDHEKEVVGLQRSYETEIDQILKDAYAKMTNYRNQVANEFDKDAYDKRISEMERRHREELEQTRAAIADIERKAAQHRSHTEQEAKNRIETITSSVQQIRNDFATRMKSLQAAVKHAELGSEERIKVIELKAKAEVEAVVKTSNEQYNAMLAEKCRDEDKLRVRLANERALALDIQKNQFEAQLAALENEKASTFDELQHVRDKLSTEVSRLQEELKEAKTSLSAQIQSKTVTELETEKQLRDIKQSHDRTLEEANTEIAGLKRKLKAVQLAAESERKTMIESTTKQMQEQRACYEAQIKELSARHSQYQQAKEIQITELRTDYESQLANLQIRLHTAESQLSALSDDVDRTKQNLYQREEECKRLRNEQHELRNQCEGTCLRLKMEHDTFVMSLKADHENALRILNDDQHSERERLETYWMAQLKGSSEAAIADINREREQFLHQISVLKEELDNSKNELSKANVLFANRMKECEDRHSEEIAALKTKLIECKNAHKHQIQELSREQKKEIEILRMDAEKRIADLDQRAKETLDLESERWNAQACAMQQRFETKLQDMRNGFELQLQHLRKVNESGDECKKMLLDEVARERQRRSELKHQVEELKDERAKFLALLDDMKNKSAETQRQYESTLIETQREYELFKSTSNKQWEIEKQRLLDDFVNERSSAASAFASKQLEHESEVSRLEQDHNNHLAKLKQDYQKKLEAAIESERETSMLMVAESLSKQRNEFESHIQELTAIHDDKVTAVVKRELLAKEEAIEKAAFDANLRFDEERAKYRATIAQIERGCNDRIHQLESKMSTTSDEMAQNAAHHRKEQSELQAILHAKNVELNRARANQLALERRVASMEEEVKQITARYNGSIERLEKENRWALQRQKSEFELVKAGLEQDLAKLRAQIDEIENRFRNRESRREDLEKIAELERLSIQQQKIVDQSIADMNMFKLELQNRDKNYNERFAAAPRVGTMQVLKAKPKTKLLNRY